VEPGIFYQGIWSFPDFSAYLNQWIVPNMLKDLETVFEGALERWKNEGEPENGRGDFILATSLFALFDHLGAFLAETKEHSLHTKENIARVAGLLQSIKDVNLIVAHLGRHALVHGAWPQTMVLMDKETWAFGLNIFAHPDESTHMALYKREYPFPEKSGSARQFKILKLRLNIRFLRRELEECVKNCQEFANVPLEVFERVQKIAVVSCLDPWKNHSTERGGKRAQNISFRDAIEAQIRGQQKKAVAQGIW
jgi:hypothetical protein